MTDDNLDSSTNWIAQIQVDPSVTKELFLQWRSPRFGKANPERMNNPVWDWLFKTRINAFAATERLGGPSASDAGPGWCFDRFGQSETQLPDGRIVFISGEHEDHYDPDFNIYNDVVVQHLDGRVDIYGYPREIFPPTDFHSATLVSDRIVIIGNLGYGEEPQPASTPVFVLDLVTLAISNVVTTNTPPGWISRHKATLSADGRSILIQHGKVIRDKPDGAYVDNIDDWRLHLDGWRWERLTERKWPRWEVRRKDGERNHLFEYQQALWSKQNPELNKPGGALARLKEQFEIPSLENDLGKRPDLELFERLYRPSVAHEALPKSVEEFNVWRIRAGGVIVRYVEDMDAIQMTVEGELPQQTLDALTRDLLDKLSTLENTPCRLIRL
ncbi:MAG: hypothetical protein AAB380_06465 [Verrucomicrobiota bacterium]